METSDSQVGTAMVAVPP
jgi:hypothetical protein